MGQDLKVGKALTDLSDLDQRARCVHEVVKLSTGDKKKGKQRERSL